jgi:transcriptional regulator with XRE-family HTH domain
VKRKPHDTAAAKLRTWVGRFENQQDAASSLGISGPYLSMILSGARKPSLRVAVILETKTGIPAREFEVDVVAHG